MVEEHMEEEDRAAMSDDAPTESTILSPKLRAVFAKYGFVEPRCMSHVDDGWVPIIDELLVSLIGINFPRDGIDQIKEKFGALRVYWRVALNPLMNYEADTLREAAIDRAARTCQRCGAAGATAAADGVRFVLCSVCSRQRGALSALY